MPTEQVTQEGREPRNIPVVVEAVVAVLMFVLVSVLIMWAFCRYRCWWLCFVFF